MIKSTSRFGILETVELISAIVYLITGKLLCTFVSSGYALLALSILMLIFTVLLFVLMKHHVYRYDKPLLTALSIYYKNMIYMTVIFNMCYLPGKMTISAIAMASIVLYMVLAYFNGKQYYQMLNAYLYLSMGSIGVLHYL